MAAVSAPDIQQGDKLRSSKFYAHERSSTHFSHVLSNSYVTSFIFQSKRGLNF